MKRLGRRSIGALVLLLAVFAQLPDACTGPGVNEQLRNEDTGAVQQGDTRPETTRAESATLDEVLSNPDEYYGQTVTLSGKVSQVLTPQAFEMGGENNDRRADRENAAATDRYGENADGLLIVANLDEISSPPNISAGETVRVTGPVAPFDAQEIEEKLGTDIRGTVLTYYRSQPSLVARSIEPAGDGTTR
jgi:hypothetical protein